MENGANDRNLVYEMICGHSPWDSRSPPLVHLLDIATGDFSIGGWAWQGNAGARDFVKGCLMVDHHHRISATEALAHPVRLLLSFPCVWS